MRRQRLLTEACDIRALRIRKSMPKPDPAVEFTQKHKKRLEVKRKRGAMLFAQRCLQQNAVRAQQLTMEKQRVATVARVRAQRKSNRFETQAIVRRLANQEKKFATKHQTRIRELGREETQSASTALACSPAGELVNAEESRRPAASGPTVDPPPRTWTSGEPHSTRWT